MALIRVDEPLGGQSRAIEITVGNADTGNPQLSDHARRDWRSVRAAKSQPGVGHGPTGGDRSRCAAGRRNGAQRNDDGCFGRAVAVEKGQLIGMMAGVVVVGRLTAGNENPQAFKRNSLADPEVGWRVKGHRDA